MSQLTHAETDEELFIQRVCYPATVRCLDCGEVAERLISEDEGEGYYPCEGRDGECGGREVERA